MLSENQLAIGDRSKFRWPRILLAVFFLLFAAVCISPFDVMISQAIEVGFLPGDLRKIFSLSEIFAHGYGVLLVLIGIWVLFPTKRIYIPRVALLAACSGLTAQLIKMFIIRERPGDFVNQWELATSTWQGFITPFKFNLQTQLQSFPSGHTATAVGLAVGLTYVFPRGKYFFATLAVLASLQRIVSYAHWTTDVLSGAAVALVVSCLLMQDYGLGRFCNRLESKAGHLPADTASSGPRTSGQNDCPKTEI
ncbi:MAG: phosphatase PAP2 family protein [Planctomycetota bacterium]|nr:phosphatase PAP2 family protein [Planctomycetota bacterium]